MIETDKFNELINDYDVEEIETRLNNIFNGYLGADTGDIPEELQQNHHLILSLIKLCRAMDSTAIK